ncbi:MAG: dephospho-CoA kinase [Candidatus Omnitrophica bacterium]|nr:dephospho-CoA kinase [Candidatus Omnitrophota bacterium]MCM8803033.1 dephospho-CoA kinase [Candidatus Omnitrophota bacterium]
MKRSVVIGITGIFGSGKTTITKILRKWKYKVISCDEIVHHLWEKKSVLKKIKKILGEEIEIKGKIDKKRIREIIFSDRKKKQELENLLHPMVFDKINKEILDTKKNGGIIFIEIPLLFETKSEKLFDKIIVVTAPQKKITERLSDKYSEKEIKNIWKNQLSLSYKKKKGDYIIDNSGSIKETEKKLKNLLTKLLKEIN